ncbi:glycine betaine ABC transporter substrate-binding protein [Ferdinandcohnia quinoae]|uniref:Glycine/betaine ABC transporter n=1 Tax=Fredinandcohnia quinoae TaxID=2918902 RepID=A0AAW5EFG2_9BACI|nr:glycine betaine ABC transporter substrate-binding protein [Fredinandcohnia sp. SECRCQ15]MCH1627549.1 glycine/betaine ABC transporter [Fredinandcohnia sp. SECRCQ15]
MFKKALTATLAIGLTLGLAACGGDEEAGTKEKSNASVGERVEYEIVGIDPGAGIMKATATAIEEYGLEDWTLIEGSGAAMTAALKKAYDKEEPIIITGWTPHWKFSAYDLKYLEDPKGVYGGEEFIHSIGRLGLKEDLPGVHKLLSQFKWEAADMEGIMVDIQDGEKPEDAAAKWIEENADTVAKWTDGVQEGNGEEVTLAMVAWDSNIASTAVISNVLTDLGYEVTSRQVEAGPMWTGVADGSVDALLAGWLPVTHEDYAKEFEGKYEDIGISMEGVKIGLVVPKYMDIDSIEDLKE